MNSYLLGIILALSLAQGRREPSTNPANTPEDLAQGQKLYQGWCAGCHGPRGDGGRGANLALPRLQRAPDERALYAVIRNGIEGTEMPRSNHITDHEVWQIVAYVRTLGQIPRETLKGDPARGEQLYRSKGSCAQCHVVAGRGGALGPPLTEIGARRSAEYLRIALLDPEAALPQDFLQVRLVTRDGRRITGVRVNESTFAIQVRDSNDRLHSFWKSELAELNRDRGKSPMPSYRGIFSPAELEDLVAYLASLRGGL